MNILEPKEPRRLFRKEMGVTIAIIAVFPALLAGWLYIAMFIIGYAGLMFSYAELMFGYAGLIYGTIGWIMTIIACLNITISIPVIFRDLLNHRMSKGRRPPPGEPMASD